MSADLLPPLAGRAGSDRVGRPTAASLPGARERAEHAEDWQEGPSRARSRGIAEKAPAVTRLLCHIDESGPPGGREALSQCRVPPAGAVVDEFWVWHRAEFAAPEHPGVAVREPRREPLDERQAHRMRFQRGAPVRRVENCDVPARREHAVVLVHLGAPVASRAVLHDADGQDEIERGIAPAYRRVSSLAKSATSRTARSPSSSTPAQTISTNVRSVSKARSSVTSGCSARHSVRCPNEQSDLEHAEAADAARVGRRSESPGNEGKGSPASADDLLVHSEMFVGDAVPGKKSTQRPCTFRNPLGQRPIRYCTPYGLGHFARIASKEYA
jgi:hypothetical protein